MSDLKDRYESFQYVAIPFNQTHPIQLATLSQIFSLEPVDPRRCRYLEVGCGNGINIIAMAEALPDSEFVGIDLAENTIAEGQALIQQLGLKNIQLIAGDLLQFPLDGLAFDYIIAHGFYSWVPEIVQQRLWLLCQRLLSSHGIAYISYNCYPGCYQRRMLREIMLFHTRNVNEPKEKVYQARAMMQFLDQALAIHGDVVNVVRHEVDQLLHHRQDYSVYHDDLAPLNEPLYFHQFISTAAQYGFQFLAESDFFEMCYAHYPPAIQSHFQTIQQTDYLMKEQYLDFLKLRRFRQTLLCRAEHRLERSITSPVIKQQLFTSRGRILGEFRLSPDEEVTFAEEKGAKLTFNHPLSKLALQSMADHRNRHWSFPDLFEHSSRLLVEAGLPAGTPEDEELLASTLFTAYSVGLLDLHCLAPSFALTPPLRPLVSPLVSLLLRSGKRLVANRMHNPVNIDSEFIAAFLQLCDGTRTRDDLIRDWTFDDATDIPLPERIDHALNKAVELALFVE